MGSQVRLVTSAATGGVVNGFVFIVFCLFVVAVVRFFSALGSAFDGHFAGARQHSTRGGKCPFSARVKMLKAAEPR